MFMLVSLFIKEKLYIGEATVATICGLIFGPHGANLINPLEWGNTDQITLEFSRIVLVVQCFAVGVELPKSYMERHWRSVVLLLVPVMTFGWLITSLFIWWMIEPLSWLESLCVAACVTATDPVLASSVVGKGKFAKRVPKHIRDLLSAESGCNDGMAFPFIYLALYLIHYNRDAAHVSQHWIVNTILYECIWGAVYGVLVGYIARHAIKLAERRGIIDRESFLVFYFVLALFCAGSGSMLGMDDLLIGFAAGVGFSNDGWFTEKTEESHVSNVIDLLLNLTYFVYFGTIIPWDQFDAGGQYGLQAWRLVVIALLVIFFRRIPVMLMLKPIIPDIKIWREALFCGHFGPIGVGAIFVAILARAELETGGGTTPLAHLPDPSEAEYTLIYTIWPIVTFLVIASIVVHGSSIAVFTLGKHINTLTLTFSATTGNENAANWMERLPRIASRSKSQGKSTSSDYSEDEKGDVPPGQLPPVGIPKLHLRRQKEEDDKPYGKPTIRSRSRRRKKKPGYGGPISESAIMPQRSSEPALVQQESGSETLHDMSEKPSPDPADADPMERGRLRESVSDGDLRRRESQKADGKRDETAEFGNDDKIDVEVYEERDHLIIEDEEGNVLETVDTRGKSAEEKAAIVEQTRARLRNDSSGKYTKHKHTPHKKTEGEELENDVKEAIEHPKKQLRDHFKNWKGFGKSGHGEHSESSKKPPERKRGPAHAYQFGSTVIVEDEDGEVIQKYDIPRDEQESNRYNDYMRERVQRMGTWVGFGRRPSHAAGPVPPPQSSNMPDDAEDTSTTSPDKEKQPEGEDLQAPAPSRPKKPQRTDTSQQSDTRLRFVISNTEQYGLTGLRKPRPGERPGIQSAASRRMSEHDFLRHMQELDKKTRQAAMSEAGIGADVQEQVNRRADARHEEERPAPPHRAGTMPLSKHKLPAAEEDEGGKGEPSDYFAYQPSSPHRTSGRKRAQSEVVNARPPEPQPSLTQDSLSNEDGEEDDIPTHNVRSTIMRHGRGSTAADARRERFRSHVQSEDRIAEEAEDDDEETAAEKRRRLAAIHGGSESDSSDEEGPRVPKRAIQEPGMPGETLNPPPREREKPAEAPRTRIQWGGETRGVVRGKGADDVEAQAESGGQASLSASIGRKIKGFLGR